MEKMNENVMELNWRAQEINVHTYWPQGETHPVWNL